MAGRRKFFRTVYQIEVISEDVAPGPNTQLATVEREITAGDWWGQIEITSSKPISAKDVAKILEDGHSDPLFFQLDRRGRTTKP